MFRTWCSTRSVSPAERTGVRAGNDPTGMYVIFVRGLHFLVLREWFRSYGESLGTDDTGKEMYMLNYAPGAASFAVHGTLIGN